MVTETMREHLEREHQIKGKSAEQIARESDMSVITVKRRLSEMNIGTTEMLLREPGGPERLIEYHGSPAAVSDATGVPVSRVMSARQMR